MSERLRSIVESLDIRPGDRVLEIRCGHGVAVTMVCQRLDALFHWEPERAHALVEGWLAPGGQVRAFVDEPR